MGPFLGMFLIAILTPLFLWMGLTILYFMFKVALWIAYLICVPMIWCWKKKQAFLGCLYLALLVFITGFVAGSDVIGSVGVWIVVAAVPLEIGVWLTKKRSEPVLCETTQTVPSGGVTLVPNEYGVYVPK